MFSFKAFASFLSFGITPCSCVLPFTIHDVSHVEIIVKKETHRIDAKQLMDAVNKRKTTEQYIKDRNVHHNLLEKTLVSLYDSSMQMKEKRARHVFSHCMKDMKEAALRMKERRARRVMSSMCIPSCVEEGRIRHTQRMQWMACFPSMMQMAITKMNHRMRMYHMCSLDFPNAWVQQEQRKMLRMKMSRIISDVCESVYQHDLMKERLRLAGQREALNHEIETYFKKSISTETSVVSASTRDVHDPFLLLGILTVVFWIMMFGIGYATVQSTKKIVCDYIPSELNQWMLVMEKKYNRCHKRISRSQKRKLCREEKKIIKRLSLR